MGNEDTFKAATWNAAKSHISEALDAMDTVEKFTFIAATEYLPPLRTTHQEHKGRHVLCAERPEGRRSGGAAIILPKKEWPNITSLHRRQ